MLERRVHLMMDEDRYALLEELAESRGVSIAALIREAVTIAFGSTSPERRRAAAWASLRSSPPIPVPDTVEELNAEIATMWDAS
jgi:hypothetical protein